MADRAANGHGPEDEEDEEEEIDETGYRTVKDAVLFAIGVSKSMLAGPEHSDPKKPDTALSPTRAALKCAYSLMQQRIISNPNDMMGVLLFGTEKSRFQDGDEATGQAGLQYPHCYLLTDLDVPAAADVKQLRGLVEDGEGEATELLQASDEEVSMANVLFCANQIFTTKAPNFSSRRLFLVTDDDYPHAHSRDARNSAAVRAKDLYDLGVTIELFPISHPDRGYTFDRNRFYNDIVYSTTPSDPDAPAPLAADIRPASSTAKDGISLLQSLLSSVASRAAPRRAIFSSVPFEIGPGLKISVKGYVLLKRQEPKRTSYVYLPPDAEKPQVAVGSTMMLAEDNARSVEKTEIRKAFKFGGETVSFSEEEMAKIRNFGDPVLRIIGFKSMDMLPIWANFKHNIFIYPSEEGYVGSTRVFSALHQKLLRDQKFGLAWYIPRRNAVPCLAAILPGAERRNDEGEQTMPPGLWIKPLPFADDVRESPDTALVPAPNPVIDAMRVVVQQLQMPKAIYDPQRYPNPSLQWFYKILQAMALEEDIPDDPAKDDKTKPKWKQIHKRAGQYVIEWGEELEKHFTVWAKTNATHVHPTSNGGAKRSNTGDSAQAPIKKAKRLPGDGDRPDLDDAIRLAYNHNRLAGVTVADLKDWLRGKYIGKGLNKKAELIEAVESYFETKMDTS